MSNQTSQEEIEVLTTIYDENFKAFVKDGRHVCCLTFPSINTTNYTIEISFLCDSYPLDHSSIEIALKSSTYYIDNNFCASILERISSENPSTNIIFQLLEAIKDHVESQQESDAPQFMMDDVNENDQVEEFPVEFSRNDEERQRKAKTFVEDALPLGRTIEIFHGPCVVEQKSTFQAHVAEVSSMEEVNYVRNSLLLDKRVSAATHNIMAYRFTDPASGLIHHDYDDDGECAAGGRLAEMVRLMGASNVIVVVSRWFGGVLLGPSRFKFICNTARNLLEEHGFCRDEKRSKAR